MPISQRIRLRIGIALPLLAVALLLQLSYAGSAPPSAEQSSALETQFAPLEKWKSAVLSGDAATLKSLYTSDPPAVTKTPAGTSSDPSAEPAFWSQLKSSGLTRLVTKIV